MKKKRKLKSSKPKIIPFKDIKFDRSLIMVLLAILILTISFIVYSNYSIQLDLEPDGETVLKTPQGDECIVNSNCLQPRCPGMKGLCENGYCVVRQIGPSTTKCIDLKTPICGNNICEADEKDTRCKEDC